MKFLKNTTILVLGLMISNPLFAGRITEDKTTFGDPSSSGDVTLEFRDSSKQIKLNNSTGQLEFSNDGSNFFPIGSGGDGAGEAKDGSSGYLNFYQKTALDLSGSGDFSDGDIKVERINDMVTVTLVSQAVFSSATKPASASGLIPAWARPALDVTNAIFLNDEANVWHMSVESDGTLGFSFRTWSGSASNRTSTGSGFGHSVTYSIGTN